MRGRGRTRRSARTRTRTSPYKTTAPQFPLPSPIKPSTAAGLRGALHGVPVSLTRKSRREIFSSINSGGVWGIIG